MSDAGHSGKVILAGAGPGDPALITVATAEALRAADVVVYDSLVASDLLHELRPETECIYVGKRAGHHELAQDQINALLIEKARAGRLVVRLKGGDPYIFGRGAEEACALEEAGVRFEIIPGITAATAASLYAGIPLTDRRFSATLTFAAGHTAGNTQDADINWPALVGLGGTLVFYMGVRRMAEITRRLIDAGMAPAMPAAVVENAAQPSQRTLAADVASIADKAQAAGVRPPALLIVGRVVSLHPRLAWFERLPLFGRKIAVTRAARRGERMSVRLRALGAEVFEIPTIDIRPLELSEADRDRLRDAAGYDYLILTSPAAVEVFVAPAFELGLDARRLAGVTIAAIGEATSVRLLDFGLRADLCPDDFVAESLLARLEREEALRGKRILIPRSGKARALVVERLQALGARVDEIKTYEPVRAETSRDRIEDVLAVGPDFITFTSSSTVENFAAILGADEFELRRDAIKAASIGPSTSRSLRALGVEPVVEAATHTVSGLIAAMEQWVARHAPRA